MSLISPQRRLRAWLVGGVLATAIGVAVRLWLLFRTPLPPGVDAAYYPYQSRSLAVLGRLAYDDVPLRFAVDALLATLIAKVTGWGIDDSALWVSRIVDAAIHPTIAVAIFLFAASVARPHPSSRERSSTRALRTALAAIAASSVAVLVGPILDMVGDFEKQSMALALTAFAWLAVWGALRTEDSRRRHRCVFATVALLVLVTATHVGTGAAACIGTVAVVAARSSFGDVSPPRLVRFIALAIALLGALWVFMWFFAPSKAMNLFTKPMSFLSGGGDDDHGPGGGPGGGGIRAVAAFAIQLAVFGTLLWQVRRRGRSAIATHDRAAAADAALAAGMVIALLAFTCPLLPGQYVHRVGLIAFTPGAFLLVYLLLSGPTSPRAARVHAFLSPPVAVIVTVSSLLSAGGARGLHMPPVLNPAGLAELREWGVELETDFSTLVVARHGLEWWAGFAMHSAVRLAEAKPEDFLRYRRILILKEKRATLPQEPNGAASGPDSAPASGPAGREPRERRGPPRDRGPGHMLLGPIPANASVLREGTWFTLYEVPGTTDGSAARIVHDLARSVLRTDVVSSDSTAPDRHGESADCASAESPPRVVLVATKAYPVRYVEERATRHEAGSPAGRAKP